ncbi:MAG: glycosyltransferase family 2 protein [Nitrospirota bacterium]
MKEHAPTVSVIIPAYNAARYVIEAVESVRLQRVRDIEIIVVDDGSTDHTAELLRPYRERGLVRYFREENSGPSTARNRGLAAARGNYISFLDADDYMTDAYLETVISFLEHYRHIDFAFTNYEVFDDGGVVLQSGVDKWSTFRSIPHYELGKGQWIFAERLTRHIIKHGGFMTTSCVTIRKRLLKEGEGFREGFFYGEDDEFFARINYRCKAGYIDRVLVRKRNHPVSLIHDEHRLLRNVAHFIKLAELQREYYRDDAEIRTVLERKIPSLIFDYCWHLIERRHFESAHLVLADALHRYRKSYPLYKLLLKNYLMRLYHAVRSSQTGHRIVER